MVDSETLFSISGTIVDGKRNRLNSEKVWT